MSFNFREEPHKYVDRSPQPNPAIGFMVKYGIKFASNCVYMQCTHANPHTNEHTHTLAHDRTLWFKAERQCIHFDLVTFDNDYIISHQTNWQLEWRTRSACIYSKHMRQPTSSNIPTTFRRMVWSNEPMHIWLLEDCDPIRSGENRRRTKVKQAELE